MWSQVSRKRKIGQHFALCSSVSDYLRGVRAQSGLASINGTVTDSSGAVLPGARISLKGVSTAQVTTVTTGSEGGYLIPFIPIGDYEITASHDGFSTERQTGIKITADQVATVNFALQPGQVNSLVEVSATAVELETASGAISQVINEKSIVDFRSMVETRRNWYSLPQEP